MGLCYIFIREMKIDSATVCGVFFGGFFVFLKIHRVMLWPRTS